MFGLGDNSGPVTGPILLVIDESTAELMKMTISPTCSTSSLTLKYIRAAEIHIGETYRVEVETTQDEPDKPVIICVCTITKADGTVVAVGEACMADMLRIYGNDPKTLEGWRASSACKPL